MSDIKEVLINFIEHSDKVADEILYHLYKFLPQRILELGNIFNEIICKHRNKLIEVAAEQAVND